uniref:Uncharacterized protein n=1 Tax=viral metagenome TaxID=1070528 RepID=A0A6C0IDC1_9ZZZZ
MYNDLTECLCLFGLDEFSGQKIDLRNEFCNICY